MDDECVDKLGIPAEFLGRAGNAGLSAELVKQRFGVLEVRYIEALSKPAINLGQPRTRLSAPALPVK